ncbi:hypothetical protein Tco_0780674, partial [Tanacetum coccineum]
METKDTLSSCSNSEEQQMQQIQDKAKKSCMVSFRKLHSHLKHLSHDNLKGTRIESGFKRAFATLFGQDVETFLGTMILNMDQLEKQLDKEEFQEIGSTASFKVLERQFQMFIKSRFYLDDEYVEMTRNKFLQYTQLTISEFRDTLIQHMESVKKSIDERAQHKREYNSWVNERQIQTAEDKVDTGKAVDASFRYNRSFGEESKEQDTSSRLGNDAHDDDADIQTHYMMKCQLAELKGNSVDTKFDKTSVLGKPVLPSLRNQSVVRQPNAFKSERAQMSKQRFASQVDVNKNLSKPVTQHYLPKKTESAFAKPDHVIASSSSRNSSKNMPRFSSNDMVHNHYLDEARKKTQERDRNSKTSVMPSARFQSTADGSKPKPRSNNQTSRSLPVSKSTRVTITAVPKADHSKSSSSFSDSKQFVCSTCHKCVFNANHDACITKLLKEVNSRAKVPSNKTTNRNKPVEQIRIAKKPERQIPTGHRFSIKKTSAVHEKTMTLRSCLRWKPTGKIFRTVGLRWVPTGKIFTPSTTKVDSEPPNGSNADITNQYESAQTLDVSAGTSNLSAGLKPQCQMTSVHNSSGLKPQCQMTSVHNSSGLKPQCQMTSVHNSSGLKPQCQMASDHVSSDPGPQCSTTVLEQDSFSPGPQSQENVPQVAESVTTSNELELLYSPMFSELINGNSPVVSKSSAVHAADNPDKRQQHNTTHTSTTTDVADPPPLNIHSTHQTPTQAPTVTAHENIIQAETNSENAQFDDDEFINIFSTPVQEQGETDGEMCMFALTVSRTEPKNIKEVMADFAWIESMQEELHQFDR